MRNAFRPAAEKQAKINVTLAKIVEAEGVTVSDEDVAAEYEALAKQYELELDKIKDMIPVEEIKSSLETRKAVKIIVDSAVASAPKKTTKKAAAPKKEKDAEGEETPKKTTKKAAAPKKETAAKKEEASEE